MSLVASLLVTALCLVLGSAARPLYAADGLMSRPFRLLHTALAGVLLLIVWLLALDALGIAWHRAAALIVPGGLGVAWLAWRARSRPAIADGPALRWGWGDLLALYALVMLVALLREPCLTMNDFVFHWGLKAQRFWLEGGIDTEFLSRPWNGIRHPDYPPLIPLLYAATTTIPGRFTEPTLILFAAVFVLGVVLAVREGLARTGTDAFLAQAGVATIAASVVTATIGLRLGGSPDLLIALVVTAGAALFLGPPNHRAVDGAIGVLAAVALATKAEGMVLAALLIGIHGCRRWLAAGRPDAGSLARMLLPSAIIGAPWALLVARHGLWFRDRAASFQLDRAELIGRELLAALGHGTWHGLGWAVVAVPLLLIPRATRAPAFFLTAQAAFYVWVYFSTTVDPGNLMRLSAPRLVLHLHAAALMLLFIALARLVRREPPAGTIGT